MYQFAIINPRNPVVPANTLGIEVTIPEVAALCDLGNIDPQHGCSTTRVRIHDPATGEDKGYRLDPVVWAGHGAIDCGGGPRDCLPLAAIDAVIAWPPPAAPADPGKCVTLATIRPDLDAFGAMAVLALRAAGVDLTADALARVTDVAATDGNTRTTWEPRPLPTAENPWPASPGSIDGIRPLAAIASVCNDRRLSVATRVAIVAAWILGGEDPSAEVVETASQAVFGSAAFESCIDPVVTMREARATVEAERADMVAALEDGRISVELAACPRCGEAARAHERGDAECTACGWDFSRIAVVRSAHRAATSLGQSVAPLAICFHPAFPWPSGEPTPKATIAWAAPPGAAVVRRVRDALNAAEREKIATQCIAAWAEKGFTASPLLEVLRRVATEDSHIDDARKFLARWALDESPLLVETRKAICMIEAGGGWGGNLASGILGSPQGRASMLSEDEIVNIVRETCK